MRFGGDGPPRRWGTGARTRAQSFWRICRYLANSRSEDALPAPALPNCWRWRRNRQLRECYITNTYANFAHPAPEPRRRAPGNPRLAQATRPHEADPQDVLRD